MKKLSNLEAYYQETNHVKPFGKLSNIEKWHLENSEGFKSFRIRNTWTNGLMYGVLGVILFSVLMAVATNL